MSQGRALRCLYRKALPCLHRSALCACLRRSAMRCLRVFVCSQCSHFCRKAEPCDKNHKNSRLFRQRTQKFAACFGLSRVYFSKNFSMSQKSCVRASKVRVRKARLACFWRKCGRTLLSRHDFGESALAHCSLGAILGKVRVREGGNGAFWGKVRVHYGDWSKNYKKIRRGLKTASKIPPLFLTREFLLRKNSRLFIARLRGRI